MGWDILPEEILTEDANFNKIQLNKAHPNNISMLLYVLKPKFYLRIWAGKLVNQ